jgi:hypothetical protein
MMTVRQILDESTRAIVDLFAARCSGAEQTLEPIAFASVPGRGILVVRLGELNEEQQTAILRRLLAQEEARSVVVAQECWYVPCPEDPETLAQVEDLKARGRLEDAPKEILRECVRLSAESRHEPLSVRVADITRDEQGCRSLGAFEPGRFVSAYPGYRRFFESRPVAGEVADA